MNIKSSGFMLIAFLVGLGIGGYFYGKAQGELDGVSLKYSLVLPLACSNQTAFAEAINNAEVPANLQPLSRGQEIWNRAKVSIITECPDQ